MKNFIELYKLINEAREYNNSKNIQLKTMKVELKGYSNLNNRHTLTIKSLKDPNIKGTIKFSELEDLKIVLKNLKNNIDLLNYINFNYRDNPNAYKLSQILTREVAALKKDLKPEEYGNLGLEFSIKSELEKEMDMQAKLAAQEAEAMGAAEGEPEATPEPPEDPPEEVEEDNLLYER
jgi:predicted transcriptional regulator